MRYRRKLSQLRAGLKSQVHAVLGKEGLLPPLNYLWGPGGKTWLDETEMGDAYETRVRSLRRLIKTYDTEITKLDARIAAEFKGHHPGYEAIQVIHGVGPVFGAIFCAELGDVTRFHSAKHVCSWAGLTPRHRESDTKIHRGAITKQGPPLVRWAAIEAVSKNHGDDPIKDLYRRVAARRGRNKARVAAARSSRWSTTGYVTTRSGASLRPRQRDWRTRSDDCELEIGMAPNRWRGRLGFPRNRGGLLIADGVAHSPAPWCHWCGSGATEAI